MPFNTKNEAIVFAKEGDALAVTYTTDAATGIRLISVWEKKTGN